MEDIAAIDTMNRPHYARAETARQKFEEIYEYQLLSETTFAGVKERYDLEEGEEWKVLTEVGHQSVEDMVQEMDEVGVEKVFIDQLLVWSRRENELVVEASVEDIAEMVDKSDGRIVPGVGYNPLRIRESLERIEYAVEDLGFEYIWFHPTTFGLKPTDQKCYPLYSKAVELDVPVGYQTGQSAEAIPIEPGRPTHADQVAADFPELKLVLTHAGWPWYREWISMLWRHPNVYGNIGAYFPSFLPDELVEFMDSGRIRDKVFWATNGLGTERCKREFLELDISDETKRMVLRDNAVEFYNL